MSRAAPASLAAASILMLGLGLGAITGATARPLTPAEGRHQPYMGTMPVCGDEAVNRHIRSQFRKREHGYWKSGLKIESLVQIRETGLRSAGLDLIPRRYCQAWALMNDGRKRRVSYWIGESLGFIGMDWGVEWCVEGLDHHRAFSPACRTAEP